MNHARDKSSDAVAEVLNAEGTAEIVLVCEHASPFIPPHFNNLGLKGTDLTSHIAWDPGAVCVAESIAKLLKAPLVVSRVSRLVYDCNRPPQAPDAMPTRSEVTDIPGNLNLTEEARLERVEAYYSPFRELLARTIAAKAAPTLVTMHSFTPVYKGTQRQVEIGLLHDSDSRLADAMLELAPTQTGCVVRRNEPYGPQDGVTHTLKEHALPKTLPNVMIEVRNDLIQTEGQQRDMAILLAEWVRVACDRVEDTSCKA